MAATTPPAGTADAAQPGDGINLTEQKLTDEARAAMHPVVVGDQADDMTPAERHEFRVATLIVRISAAQKRMAENFARMAERLVDLADVQAEASKAMDELTELMKTKPGAGR